MVNAVCLLAILAILLGLQEIAAAGTKRQKTFETPEATVTALVKAVQASNPKYLMRLLGPGSKAIVISGDNVQDRQNRTQFLRAYKEKNRLEPGADGAVRLFIGKDDWPFPFPIVKDGKYWRFDAQAGKEEVLNRRIGKNELNAMQVCLAIADAQRDYSEMMADMKGRPEYAQKFESVQGQKEKDGLFWETAPNDKQSPLGPLISRARAEGYDDSVNRAVPYHGYLYNILSIQGESANGGIIDYVIDGKMIGGFAVVAFPALYGSSGIHTIITNHEGVIYLKDLGKDTVKTAADMKAFNPDKTWKKADKAVLCR